MTSAKYKITWKTFLMTIAGLAAFLAYIFIFNVDLTHVAATIQQTNLRIYLLAAAASLTNVFLFSVAWNILLRHLAVKISILKSLLFVWFGIFIDTLIPAESIGGEIAKVYLVSKENGNTAKATASLVTLRLISMGTTISTLFIGATLLFLGHQLLGMVLNLTVLLVAMTFLFLTLTLVLCIKEEWTLKVVDTVVRFVDWLSRGRWKLDRMKEQIIESAKVFHAAMRDYGRAPKTLFAATLFYVAAWLLDLVVFYLVFLSIGYTNVSWSTILVVGAIFMAIKSVPVGIPFEVGLPEIVLTMLYQISGIPSSVSATVTILTRVLTHWFRFFIGFGVQQYVGVKVSAALEPKAKTDESELERPKSVDLQRFTRSARCLQRSKKPHLSI